MSGSHAFLWLGVVALLAFGVWSVSAQLDVVITARGEVVPESKVKRVGHLDKGIVAAINVEEGDVVEAGKTLVELDPTQAETSANELKAEIDGLRIRKARLVAAASNKSAVSVPSSLEESRPHLVSKAKALFAVGQRQHRRALAAQREVVKQREQKIATLQARLNGSRESIQTVNELLEISERLLQENITSRMEHLRLQQKKTDIETRIAETKSRLTKTKAGLAEAKQRLEGKKIERAKKASEKLAKTNAELATLRPRYRRLVENRNRTKIRAPVDGVIKKLAVNTVGGIVQPGRPIATVVPRDGRLIIAARLPSQDVGFVEPGQSVRIRLAGAAAKRFEPIQGTVTRIAPDAQVTKEGSAYYEVRIKPRTVRFKSGDNTYALLPGVRVRCSIVTGSRSVARYLLDPWLQGIDRAMQER